MSHLEPIRTVFHITRTEYHGRMSSTPTDIQKILGMNFGLGISYPESFIGIFQFL